MTRFWLAVSLLVVGGVALFIFGHPIAGLLLAICALVGGLVLQAFIRMVTLQTVYRGAAKIYLPQMDFQAALPISDLPARLEIPGVGEMRFNIQTGDVSDLLKNGAIQDVEVAVVRTALDDKYIAVVYFPASDSSLERGGWLYRGKHSLIDPTGGNYFIDPQ